MSYKDGTKDTSWGHTQTPTGLPNTAVDRSRLALALTGLAAALTLVGVAGLFALPALMALSWFGLLPSAPVGDQPGGEAAGGTEGDTKVQSVFDKTLDEKVALLQEEMTGFREDMKKYFGSGGTVFPEFQKSTQNALENAS